MVHTHGCEVVNCGIIAAKLARVDVVATVYRKTDKKISRFIWKLSKKVIFTSKEIQKYLLKHNCVPKKKCKVIYAGIDISIFESPPSEKTKKNLRKNLGLKEHSFLVGNIGRLAPEEDQATLLKAFRKLIKKEVDAELIIVGDGPFRLGLEKLAQDFRLGDRVKFLGNRKDAMSILNIIDVFVLSSIREGSNSWILNAMVAAKPVVVPKIGIYPEIVADGESGFLVPCGFPERIESALKKLHAQPSLSVQIGKNARNQVEDNFNLEREVIQYLQLYEK